MNPPSFDEIFQGASLLVLAATVFVAYRQLKAATEQARASEAQAKSSEQMARLSLQQTELMRAQLHAAFKPVIEATCAENRINSVTFILQNVGNSTALGLIAICRSGYRERLGTLASDGQRRFEFESSFNSPPEIIGPPEYRKQFKLEVQSAPLRLEYLSVSGARCRTNVKFPLGHEGAIEIENEYGME